MSLFNRYFEIDNFDLWYEMFCLTTGRIQGTPQIVGDDVFVCYTFDSIDDCNSFHESYFSLIRPKVEVKKSKIKAIKRKLCKLFGVRK